MIINETFIDQVELMEYWRMSLAYEVSRYKRLQWASRRYATAHDIPSIRAYKALDTLIQY